MGIGLAFDGALYLIGKGSAPIRAKIAARNQNIEDQTIESGLAQIRKAKNNLELNKMHLSLIDSREHIYQKLNQM